MLPLQGQTGATTVSNFEIFAYLQSQGVENAMPIQKGGTSEVGGIKVTATHAMHGSSIALDDGSMIYGGEPLGYVVEFESGFKLYHAGDTCIFGDMQLIVELYRPDLTLLPISNQVTTSPYEAAHAARLLGVMLAALPKEGFAYSLLRAYRPILYERHGWVPIADEVVRAELPPFDPASVAIEPFDDHNLPEVMRLCEQTNAERTGPTIRSPEYWQGQLEWLEEDRDGFMVARRENGTLAGYVRSRAREDVTEVLELAISAGDAEVGRTLLSAVAGRRGRRIRANLPPSLRGLLLPDERKLIEEFGLMGRVIDLEALAAALEPVWLRRIKTSGNRGGSFRLSAGAGTAEVRASGLGIRIYRQETEGVAISVDEQAFAYLLFRGFDTAADERVATVRDPSLLRVLFPAQDFVV